LGSIKDEGQRAKPLERHKGNASDYGYPSLDIEALSAKALEVTRRLTEYYGELPFSNKDPMSQLVDIIKKSFRGDPGLQP